MVFNSYTFIAFFIIVLILHNLPFSWKMKKINLLLASYIFYAAWNPPFILLLWLSTVVDYFVGRALYTQNNVHKKRVLLVISLIGNLGMLCFFKYGGFLLENFVHVVNAFGVNYHPAKPSIILPAGISFYTFTTLCYTIDMYKKESRPVRSMLDFSLFVTFFPHLVAGPIVRPPQLVPQFETPRVATRRQLTDGLFLLSLGLFMKVVLADSMLSASADAVFNSPGILPSMDAWMGMFAFTGQIFFDFAGYSTCAIGAALCLGFVLPQNFRFPYAAIGFSDFWRRWHITLSSWLRDYLYIPLGGNRKGAIRTYINLMLTMLLGGLWHGANWTFVAWGGLHGLYLWVEKFFQDRRQARLAVVPDGSLVGLGDNGLAPVPMPAPQRMGISATGRGSWPYALFTFLLVDITWVFFRSSTFGGAGKILGSMFGVLHGGTPLLTTLAMIKIAVIISLMLVAHWVMRNTRILDAAYRLPWWVTGLLWSSMVILLILSQASSSSFIYFQF
ncbi:MAG TPA: MBOAT family O-acyltransferase [Puia sp.]|jgi:D-alanyl-lipoteichoic acid acyltransferase DltB (MBOAT superfamily)